MQKDSKPRVWPQKVTAKTPDGRAVQQELQIALQQCNVNVLELLFVLPVREAAEALGLGITCFKLLTRRCGLKRWPHRHYESMVRLLEHWCQDLSAPDDLFHDIIAARYDPDKITPRLKQYRNQHYKDIHTRKIKKKRRRIF